MASTSDRVYVWAWLPQESEPIPVGALRETESGTGELEFAYGRNYLDRANAISLFPPELPLERNWFPPAPGIGMPSAIKDAAPDAWGMRVILNLLTAQKGRNADVTALPLSAYLLASGSDRIGALDFQASATEYLPREEVGATVEMLLRASELIEAGENLPPAVATALLGGTSIGGARPKALLRDDTEEGWVAKFPSSTDVYNVIGAEAAAIYLANEAGIAVPEARMVRAAGKDVLLTRRFDRGVNGTRRLMLTGVTLLGQGVSLIPRGSYPEVLDVLQSYGDDAGGELFSRVALNIAISNDDDHLRNLSAFWDGAELRLTPAYDLSPGLRRGTEMNLATALDRSGTRSANFAALQRAHHEYGLSRREAEDRITEVVDAVSDNWHAAADFARMTKADRAGMWGRQFLNSASFDGIA